MSTVDPTGLVWRKSSYSGDGNNDNFGLAAVSASVMEGWWDAPWYRVRCERFEAAFLPGAGEDLDAVDNVDVFVHLPDGSRWSGTVFTLAQVEALMAKWAESGEALGGRYFSVSDGLIVRDAGVMDMAHVIGGLIEDGEFPQIFRRLDDE
ncbi:hypothetical protein AB0I91_41240 [Actinosynnema sp. NPDC049800]